jgi:hypothetical protein
LRVHRGHLLPNQGAILLRSLPTNQSKAMARRRVC